MLKNKILIFFGVILIFATSCKDDALSPILTFDKATKGAYVRLVEQGNTLVNLLDISGSAYVYTVEFVDLEQGALVAEYRLQLSYEDNNPENGDKSAGPVEFRTWSASDFETSAMGFKGLSNITITGPELLAAFGLSEADIIAGDIFQFNGFLTTTDGAVYGAANSSASVNGAGFRGHFDFPMPANCPSDLTGTYAYTSADSWCGNGAIADGTVEILDLGGGSYHFSDWSFGAYDPCYGAGAVAAQPTLIFTEVCEEVSFTGFVDSYGCTWSYDSEIDGAVWRIKWDNSVVYGELGETWITHPSGAWPFTLK